jgi:hypothetical protein
MAHQDLLNARFVKISGSTMRLPLHSHYIDF